MKNLIFKTTLYITLCITFHSNAQTFVISLSGTADNTDISANSFDGGTDDTIFEKDGFHFFGDDNNNGVPSSSQIQYYNASSTGVGTTGGFYNLGSVYTPETRMVVKKADGNEFDFVSVIVTEWSGFYTPIIFEAYKDGSFTGSQTINNSILSEFTVNLNTTFDDVDEVRIHSPGGFGEQFSYDNFVFELNTLSTSEFDSNNNLNIYPNPSYDFIQISGLVKINTFTIYNALGAKVVNGNVSENEQIDIKNLTTGLYFLKLNNGNTIKFIKK